MPFKNTEAVTQSQREAWHLINFDKFLRTSFFIEHFRWLLVKTIESLNYVEKNATPVHYGYIKNEQTFTFQTNSVSGESKTKHLINLKSSTCIMSD